MRVYQNFATLDAVSNGRAQLILGRGSAIESFPLFGYDLRDYEAIFEEKLALFVALLRGGRVTWQGTYRPPLDGVILTPPVPEGNLPTWVGSGGSPESVLRAARYGLPLMLAVIGGRPERFRPLVELYRRALAQDGSPSSRSACTRWPTSPAPTRRRSRRSGRTGSRPLNGPRASAVGGRRRERSSRPRSSAARCSSARPRRSRPGSQSVMRTLDAQRLGLHYAIGKVPYEQRAESIRLLGTEVFPRVRELLAAEPAVDTAPTPTDAATPTSAGPVDARTRELQLRRSHDSPAHRSHHR